MYEFKETVDSESALREIIGEPSERATGKTIDALDRHCKAFIGRSPFVLIASSNKNGSFDISPKGDPCGFVQVLDNKTLLIPERPGNKRADTFTNVLQNPHVGLFFLVPPKKETLRVNGRASIVRDSELLAGMAVNGKVPNLGLAIFVEEAFFHCAKCIVRSSLWQPERWPEIDDLPTLAQTMVDGGKLDITVDEMQKIVDKHDAEHLY